jgi:hypothetical protein
MSNVIKGYVFNQKANVDKNRHMFLMSRANLGVSLRDLNIDPDIKFSLIDEFSKIHDYIEIDSESFKKVMHDKLLTIRTDLYVQTNSKNNATNVIDGLIKFFRL